MEQLGWDEPYQAWSAATKPCKRGWGILVIGERCPDRDGETCKSVFPTESGKCVREECPLTFQKMICEDCQYKSTDISMDKNTWIEEVKVKALEVRYCTQEEVEGVDWGALWDFYGDLSPEEAARKAHQDRGGTPGISVDH